MPLEAALSVLAVVNPAAPLVVTLTYVVADPIAFATWRKLRISLLDERADRPCGWFPPGPPFQLPRPYGACPLRAGRIEDPPRARAPRKKRAERQTGGRGGETQYRQDEPTDGQSHNTTGGL